MATALRVRTETTDQLFHASFRIGRAEDCGLRIQNDFVSRYHAEVVCDGTNWFVRDLGSSNGIFVSGVRVPETQIVGSMVIRLGIEGPAIGLKLEQAAAATAAPAAPAPLESTAVFAARYFKEPAEGEAVGEHTQMVR